MRRVRFLLSASLAATFLAGCGGNSLFATVPPPVEFVGTSIRPSAEELPPAGTYPGTVDIDRATYSFDVNTGKWTLQSSESLGSSSTAQAIVGAGGGTITIQDGEELFSGTLLIVHGGSPSTQTTLTAKDGSTVTYPYALYHDAKTTLRLAPHLKTKRLAKYLVQFDRYSFNFALD